MPRISLTLGQVPFKEPRKAAPVSGVDVFLPCPALRPHACLGLHKGHTRATAEVGGGEKTKGTPSQRHSRKAPRQFAPSWGPGGGAGRRGGGARPSRSLRPAHPARPGPFAAPWASAATAPAHPPSAPAARRAARGRGPSVARTGFEGTLGDPGLRARLQCWAPRRDWSRPPRGRADQEAGAH